MKIFRLSVLVLSLIFFACSSDGDEKKDGVTSIAIEANEYFVLDYGNVLDIKVVDNRGNDVSNQATISFDGEIIDGTSVEINSKGSYVISANYNGIDAPNFNVNADVVSSLSLEKDRPHTVPGGYMRLTAKDNFGNEVPNGVTFTINGNTSSEGVFTFQTEGTYTVEASYNSMFNGEVKGEVNFDVRNYTKRVLVEDYTGAWCGYCPRIAYKLEKAEELNPKVIGVGIHNGDAMRYSREGELRAYYNVTGFPTAKVNRTSTWTEYNLPWNGPFNSLDNLTGEGAEVGISFESTVAGSEVSLDLNVEFATTTTGKKLVVYLVEDGLVYPQENYFNSDSSSPWFGRGGTISNFIHDNVLRKTFTDVFGDSIELGEGKDSYNYKGTLTLESNYKAEHCEIIAFVIDGSGKVINVQHANLGSAVSVN